MNQDKNILNELREQFTKAGGNWLKSDLVVDARRKRETTRRGQNCYRTFKSLKSEHGEDKAKELRASKKALQAANGDFGEDCPYWMRHPDFGTDEVWVHSMTCSLRNIF